MADFEVALTTENSGENFCISVWDLSSGMQLKSYKGGSCSSHGLSVVGNDYVMAAQLNKPILHLWNTAKEQVHMKLICPSKVTAAVCSPDAKFCVVSCSEKIYVWQIATGNLLAVLSRHYQSVTCLKFTDDGSHFISGGEDNLVMVWKLVRVVSNSLMHNWSQSSDTDRGPIYTWSDHSLPVMDLHCGCGGMRAHVVTASLDQTCKLYDLGSGQLLCSFVFSSGISAVVMDTAEWNLFAGAVDGNIYQVQLYQPGIKQETHITKEESLIFQGHSKQVTCLAVSTDCGLLLSGSTDATAHVWHIPSRQCLRTVNHRGSVTNAQIIPRPLYLDSPPPRPQWAPVQPFKRHISTGAPSSSGCIDVSNDGRSSQPSDVLGGIPIVLSGTLHKDSLCESTVEGDHKAAREKLIIEVNQANNSAGNGDSPQLTRQQLEQEVERLKKVNSEFYCFAIEELLTEVRNVNEEENT